MNRSVKSAIALFAVVGAVLSLASWTMSRHPDHVVWVTRFAAPAATLAIMFLIWKLDTRRDVAPDLLREQFGWYFEQEGLCFIPEFASEEGGCVCRIYFQNRYARPCLCDVVIQPSQKRFSLRRHQVPTVTAQINCPGAAVGVARLPYMLPPDYRGRSIRFDIAATVNYPDGRGKLLRFREGTPVGEPSSDMREAAKTLGFMFIGAIRYSRPARAKLLLPNEADNAARASQAGCSLEIVWQPDAEEALSAEQVS